MTTFTVYRQTVKSVKESSDFINRVGWEGVIKGDNLSAKLKLESSCLFEEEQATKLIPLIKQAIEENVLLPVAKVECKDLNDAFELTNSITTLWTNNPKVMELPTDEDIFFNSSSGGDIFVNDETNEMSLVMSMGFMTI